MTARSRLTRTVVTAGAVVAATVLAATGCGSRAPGPSTISPGASASLTQQVSALRAAAARHQQTVAKSQLEQLRASVATLQHQGQISSARSAAILAAAAEVDAQLATLATPSPSSLTSTTNAVPSGPGGAAGTGPTGTSAQTPQPSGGGKGRGKDPKQK